MPVSLSRNSHGEKWGVIDSIHTGTLIHDKGSILNPSAILIHTYCTVCDVCCVYFYFMGFLASTGTPVNRIPIMAKQVLDLYMLYKLVTEKGGLVEVINKKIWREITKGLNLPTSITSAAFTLRTQ